MKTIKVVVILVMLVLSLLPMMIVKGAGPNYMGFTPNPKDVTVGDSFRFDVYGDIHSAIDTIAVDNMTFLPAGIVNYTSGAKGVLFMPADLYTVTFHTPVGGGIHNALGYAKYCLWAFDVPGYGGRINNANATAFNLTWLAYGVGTATITITAGGTAAGGTDPGTTKYTGTVRVHPQATTGLTATMVNSTKIDLSWTKHTGDDKTLIRYKSGSSPTSVTDGTLLYNDSGSSTSQTGLSAGQHVYYSAWGWSNSAGFYSLSYSTADATTNNIPSISSPNPANGAPNIDKTQSSVSASVTDADGSSIAWTIETSLGNSNSGSGVGGTKTCSLSPPLTYGITVTWWVNVTDGYDTAKATYTFDVRDEYIAGAPTGFTATPISRFRIDLSWSTGSGADKTYVVAKLGSDPTSRTDGINVYNNTGTSYSHTPLLPSEHWYYRAYSWNNTDSSWSTAYASDDATTLSNSAPNQPTSPQPANNSPYVSVYNEYLNATVSDPDGDTLSISFYWNNGTLIHTVTGVASGGKASIYLPTYTNPAWLTHDLTHEWYVTISDGIADATHGPTWNFKTSKAWDVDENADINYLDVSNLVSHYGDTVVAGSIGADINNDGTVSYTDISALVSHYGESY